MQQNPRESARLFVASQIFAPVMMFVLVACTGCSDRPSTLDVEPNRPFKTVTLKVAASDPSDLSLLRDFAKSWSNRHHARMIVSEVPGDESADLFLIAPAELSQRAEEGKLAELPSEYLAPTHPYRWDDIFTVNSLRLCGWKDKTYAVPVIGEGMIFAYRIDQFNGKSGRPGSPPKTWEEILDRSVASPNKELAVWPKTTESREGVFFSLAASLDRAAINRLPSGTLVRDEFFSFHIDPATGKLRLSSPAFIEAGQIMQRLTPLQTAGSDPAESFNQHAATMGFLTLRDLARVKSEVAGKLGILPLPGTTHTYGMKGERVAVPGGNFNRLPYLGWGGRLGVVSSKCERPDAAWDFWTDAGMPEQQSLDLIGSPERGAGPFRASQLDARVKPRWLGYRLTANETERLTAALRDNLGIGIQNYRTRLRTPNERELRLAFQPRLEDIISGKEPVEKALRECEGEWNAIIGKLSPEQWRVWVRKSLGL